MRNKIKRERLFPSRFSHCRFRFMAFVIDFAAPLFGAVIGRVLAGVTITDYIHKTNKINSSSRYCKVRYIASTTQYR